MCFCENAILILLFVIQILTCGDGVYENDAANDAIIQTASTTKHTISNNFMCFDFFALILASLPVVYNTIVIRALTQLFRHLLFFTPPQK